MPRQKTQTWNAKTSYEFVEKHLKSTHQKTIEQNPELLERIELHFLDFWESHYPLYSGRHDYAKELTSQFDTVINTFLKRPDYLKKMDTQRYEHQDWFQRPENVGMMLYVDLFAGNLKKLAGKISYFEELGINYIHLMPLFKTRKGKDDGGYAVSSYREFKKELGTKNEFKKVAKLFHDKGISLVLDFPMNHTAIEHEWAQKALKGDPVCQDYYYMFDDREMPDKYEETLPEVFPNFAPDNFVWQPGLNKWIWSTFYPFQWDLNYTNPAVFRNMFKELMAIINYGVDIVRLDAVPFIWKRLGTNCQNQPEAHMIVRAYRALVRMAAPGTIFKAEAIVAPDDIIQYLGVGGYEGKECDLAYNATLMNHLWHALASESTHLLRTTLSNLPAPPKTSGWINYIRCHDDIGWGISNENAEAIGQNGYETRQFCTDFYRGALPESYAEGYAFSRDKNTGEARISGTAAALAGLQKAQIEANPHELQYAIKRLLLLNNVIFSLKGLPLIYAGDEIGQLNDFTYLKNKYKRDDNRWVHRPQMDWQKAELRHHTGTVEHQLFNGLKLLSESRKSIEAFHDRSDDKVLNSGPDALFAVERKYKGEKVLLLSNFSSNDLQFPISELPGTWQAPVFMDRIQQANIHFSFRKIVLPAYGYLWLSPTQKVMPKKLVEIPLSVLAETQWGEKVYITGNINELGNWNAHNAVGPLNADDYPVWQTVIQVPEHTVIEYKWIKKRDDGQVVGEAAETGWIRTGSHGTTQPVSGTL